MEFREEKRDLFSVPEDYYLAHCISADFAMGKGIVVEFNRRFDMKNKLKAHYPDYLDQWQKEKKSSGCVLAGRVFNLITKERYFQKPTYETMRGALECMKALCAQKRHPPGSDAGNRLRPGPAGVGEGVGCYSGCIRRNRRGDPGL